MEELHSWMEEGRLDFAEYIARERACELSFMEQTQRYHAAGGDLDSPVFELIQADGSHIQWGHPRLSHAALQGWYSAMTWLLQNGADVHRGCASGCTPLHAAVEYDQHGAVVLLLDAGARLDQQNTFGWTALHAAAYYASIGMCKLLLSRGASLDERIWHGRDPEASTQFLTEVHAAGGWTSYVAAPRLELLELRRALAALRERGRASPSSVLVHEVLFLRDDVPDDVFSHILTFWRSDRDYYTTNYPH